MSLSAGTVRRAAAFALGDLLVAGWCLAAGAPAAASAPAPGVVIDYSPAATRRYIGSPSLAVLPDGAYVASHDFFGPGCTNSGSVVFGSRDRGASWRKLAELDGQWWSTLFVHRDALYLLGTTGNYGAIAIRRSRDGGRSWTAPALLRADGSYHGAPTPVLVHAGRLWRAFEQVNPAQPWGANFRAGMLSAPVAADLLNPANWTASTFLPGDPHWLAGTFGGWLEGNAVATRDGPLLDILRVDTPTSPEKAALVRLSPDGRTARFDPQTGFADFPGGAKKFTIRYDAKTDLYWSLVNFVPAPGLQKVKPACVRNTLALTSSPDLTHWTVRRVLLSHPDSARHGFQYVDWLFDGEDMIAVCRTAFDGEKGGAHNFHDANMMTFLRIRGYGAAQTVERKISE